MLKTIFFIFLFISSSQLFSQNFYTITITNNTNCEIDIDIYGDGGVYLATHIATRNTTSTYVCQAGKPGNIVFLGCSGFQIPINQVPIQVSGGCCLNGEFVESNMNTTAATVPGTCNGGIGFYWNLNLIIG